MKRYIHFLVVLFLLFFFFGCSKPAAEVNGEKITRKTFESVLKSKLDQHSMPGVEVRLPELKNAVIEQLIGEKLLLQSAREEKISVSGDEVEREFNTMRKRVGEERFREQLKKRGFTLEEFQTRVKELLVIRRYIESLVPGESLGEEEIKDYYKNSPKPFIKPVKVFVKLIQTKNEEEANGILLEMKDKKLSFDEMGDKLSETGKAIVSNYGWTETTFFSKEISDALKTIKKGTFGGPYPGKDGYYLLMVKDRQKEGIKSYDEAKEEIKNILLNQKRQATIAHLIADRKKKSTIKVYIQ